MAPELLHEMTERLRGRSPVVVDLVKVRRAAVGLILAPSDEGLQLLLIRRAEQEGDPWSGHMAFPGGHQEPSDTSLVETAIRETQEEVGIDLAREGEFIARLDEVRAHARGHDLDMVVTPFFFTLGGPRETRVDHREVAQAIWVPFAVFREERFHGTTSIARGDFRADFPAFLYEGHAVWGMTYRMIRDFLNAALPQSTSPAAGE